MATIGLRSLAMLFGAGYSGSYLYNNQDKARNIADMLLNQNSQKTTSLNVSQSTTPTVDVLSDQMARLTREVTRTRSEPVVVMAPSGYKGSLSTISDLFNLLGWAVVAVSVSGVVYFVAYRKRFRLTDLAWVSQSTFNATITAMQQGITRVNGAVGAVKRDLGDRLRNIEGRVERVRSSLSEQIEAEVAVVKDGVSDVGDEVTNVKNVLGDVNLRIDKLDTKIDFATNGIVALVKAISSVAPERLTPGSPFYELRKFADLSSPKPDLSGPMVRQRVSFSGLRGILSGEEESESQNERLQSLDKGSHNWTQTQ